MVRLFVPYSRLGQDRVRCALVKALSYRSGLALPRSIVGYRKMWLRRIAKLVDLPADITPHVLRHSFASLAADLGYNEPTIASLLGHKTHSITSRYMHSADVAGSSRGRGQCHHPCVTKTPNREVNSVPHGH